MLKVEDRTPEEKLQRRRVFEIHGTEKEFDQVAKILYDLSQRNSSDVFNNFAISFYNACEW